MFEKGEEGGKVVECADRKREPDGGEVFFKVEEVQGLECLSVSC